MNDKDMDPNERWHLYNDKSAQPICIKETQPNIQSYYENRIISKSAYILFYKKCKRWACLPIIGEFAQ